MRLRELFPYEVLRDNQERLASLVLEAFKRRKFIAVDAPNGMGKTISVLVGAISFLMENPSQKVIYAVRTHSQARRVLDEMKRLASKRRDVNYSFLRGMGSSCPLLPVSLAGKYASLICSLMVRESECNVNNCPYRKALRRAEEAQLLVVSYPYIFEPFVSRILLSTTRTPPLLIMDEAHNLLSCMYRFYSSELDLMSAYEASNLVGGDLKLLIEDLILRVARSGDEVIIPLNVVLSSWDPDRIREILSGVERRFRSQRSVYDTRIFLHKLLYMLEHRTSEKLVIYVNSKKANTVISPVSSEGLFEDVVASRFSSGVFISGTLGPDFSEEVGYKMEYSSLSFRRRENLYVLLTKGISTAFRRRSDKLFQKIATTLVDMIKSVKKNVGIFFPSYEFMSRVLSLIDMRSLHKRCFVESKDMTVKESNEMLSQFKESSKEGAVLFGVQRGRCSEGEDFPGDYMAGVVVIGLPYPYPDKLLLARMSSLDKKEIGRGYKYLMLIPAVRTSVQTAARVARGERKEAFIVLADERFMREEVLEQIPSWLRNVIRPVMWEEVPLFARRVLG